MHIYNMALKEIIKRQKKVISDRHEYVHSEEIDGTLGMCECVRMPLPSDYGDLDVKAVSRE